MESSSETYTLPQVSSAATNSSVNSTGASKIIDIEACAENWTPASSMSSSMTSARQLCSSPQWTDPLDFLLDPQAYDGMTSTSAQCQTFVFEDDNCAKEDFLWMRTIMEIDQENRLKKKKLVKTDDASRPKGMNPQETRSSDVMEHSYGNESLQGQTSEDILAECCERSETCVKGVAPIAEPGNDIAAYDSEKDGSDEVSRKQVPVEMPITGKVYVDGVELLELMESPSSACTLSNISSSSSQSTFSVMSASSSPSLSFSKDDIVKEEYEPKKAKETKKRKKGKGEMGLYQEAGKKSAMKAEDETSKSRKKRKKKKMKKKKYNANKAQLQLQLLPSSEIALSTTDMNEPMSLQLLTHVDLESKRCLRAMLETMRMVLERYERGTLVALDELRNAVLEECVHRRKRYQRTSSCVIPDEYADIAAASKDQAAFDKALTLLQTKDLHEVRKDSSI